MGRINTLKGLLSGSIYVLFQVLWIRIQIRKNMQILAAKYQPKMANKNILLSNPKSEILKRNKFIRISLSLNGTAKFSIKVTKKKKKNNLKILLLFRKPVHLKEMFMTPDPLFFIADPDPFQNEMDSEHCLD